MLSQSTLISYHTDAYVKTEVGCTVTFSLVSFSSTTVHLDYNTSTFDNDIAVLKLESKITFVQNIVQPACLPEASFAPDETGVISYVSGWGNIDICPACQPQDNNLCETHESSEDLRFVKLPLLSNAQCAVGTVSECAAETDGYQLAPEGSITENMVCAGFMEGGKDSCQVQYI